MRKNKRLDSEALGWMALAILCTALLAYPDLIDGSSERATELLGGWNLIEKTLLVVCLVHVAIHTIDFLRYWIQSLKTQCAVDKVVGNDNAAIPGADPRRVARLNADTRRDGSK